MKNWGVSQGDIYSLIRNRVWAIALTAGSITATVSYWISQLPVAERELIKAAIQTALKSNGQ